MVDANTSDNASVDPKQFERVNAPVFNVSSFQTLWAGNDLTMIVGRPHPMINNAPQKPEDQFGAVVDIQAILTLSAQSAKDFAIILTNAVAEYEKRYGVITTEFTKQRQA